MTKKLANWIQETTTTTGTGTITLAGAVTGFQSLNGHPGIVNADEVYYSIINGNNRETGIGTFTASGTTLSRDTILETLVAGTSDITSPTAITLAGTSTVYISPISILANLTERQFDGFIHGVLPSWTDINTIAWSAGQAVVNGELLEFAGSNTGDIGQSSDGLSVVGLWYHYLYNNAGTPTIEMSQTVPLEHSSTKFWYKTGDVTRRFIAWHKTWDDAATRKIVQFIAQAHGNILQYEHETTSTPMRVQLTAPGSTFIIPTTVNPNTILPKSSVEVSLNLALGTDTDASDLTGFANPDNAPSTISKSTFNKRATFNLVTGTHYTFFGAQWMMLKPTARTSFYIASAINIGTLDNFLLTIHGVRAYR